MSYLFVFLFYAFLSALFLRPLFPVFSFSIPGGLEDTRLFLWNAWWFRYAIDSLHTNPFFTRLLFHPFGCSLISHDFPMWTNAVTYAAQNAGLNILAASNVWFILSWILAGFCTYLLVWELTQARGPAIVAGLYVMTHSYTLARAMQNWGQFNLYGIALFLWTLARAHRTKRSRDYVISGAALAWTAACHYYFLIYSGTIWLACAAANYAPWQIQRQIPPHLPFSKGGVISDHPPLKKGGWGGFFLGVTLLAEAAAAWIIFLHPADLMIGHAHIGLETPANALLVMWLGAFGFIFSKFRISIQPRVIERTGFENEILLGATALVCLSPLLIGAIKLALVGGYPKQGILWKTHLPGANLFSLFMPNPLNAWWGPAISRWYDANGMNAQEQAASIGWVCLAIVGWSQKVSLPTMKGINRWLCLAIASTVMAMGTYLHILQYNLWMPLPFYLWRLLPVFGNVRVPERWMAVGAIAWGVVLALALIALAKKKGWRLNTLCGIVGALILVENWPGIPLGAPPPDRPVYETLRQLPPGGVLPLPLYIGDSSIGAGNAPPGLIWDNLAVQIYHHQPVLGGYIGRIPRTLITLYKIDPFFGRLIDLEEEKIKSEKPLTRAQACLSMQMFGVSYVLIYSNAVSHATMDFVDQSLPLHLIQKDDNVKLLRLSCS